MTESKRTPLQNLIALGKVDISLAKILFEKKQLTEKFAKKTTELRQAENALAGKMRTYNERKARFDKEETAIREERDKLVARRKALASLNNYKVQQAAEKEIEHANRQLAVREDSLLASLQELETSISENAELEQAVSQFAGERSEIESEIKSVYPGLEAQEKELKKEREEIIRLILPAYMHTYERIRIQHSGNPVVAADSEHKSCSACHIQIRPQVMVELHKGERIVNCPGCGRILYLEAVNTESS